MAGRRSHRTRLGDDGDVCAGWTARRGRILLPAEGDVTASRGGAPRGDRRVARLLDEEHEPMVVGTLRSLRGHACRIPPVEEGGSR